MKLSDKFLEVSADMQNELCKLEKVLATSKNFDDDAHYDLPYIFNISDDLYYDEYSVIEINNGFVKCLGRGEAHGESFTKPIQDLTFDELFHLYNYVFT